MNTTTMLYVIILLISLSIPTTSVTSDCCSYIKNIISGQTLCTDTQDSTPATIRPTENRYTALAQVKSTKTVTSLEMADRNLPQAVLISSPIHSTHCELAKDHLNESLSSGNINSYSVVNHYVFCR